jgi:hypothetical protein
LAFLGLAFLGLGKARMRRGIATTNGRMSQKDISQKGHHGIFKGQAMARRRPTRSFPGRLTLEEWLARPSRVRNDLIRRAQCDLVGSFRFCANKRCRRERTCCGDDPGACGWRLWCLKKVKPKTVWNEWSRLARLRSL